MNVLPNSQVVSNQAKVTDAEAIDRAACNFFCGVLITCFRDEESNELFVDVQGVEWMNWPLAVNYSQFGLDPRDDHDPEDLEHLLEEHGEEGFLKLLLEIAPHLLTPLTIQAIRFWENSFPMRAAEWRVRPGAKEIEVNEFSYFHDEEGAD